MDKSMFEDLKSSLPPQDQPRMDSIIDQLQIKNCLRTYNTIVERCYTDCVESFYSKTVIKKEEGCVMRCADKFMKLSMRVGLRLAELRHEDAAKQEIKQDSVDPFTMISGDH